MCPFCYIGKRRLEQALEQLSLNEVEITWKSFLLNPELQTDLDKSALTYLAENKGMPIEQVRSMFVQVEMMAKEVGLSYTLEKTIVANSMKAHRFLHYAKHEGKQDVAKERVLAAHFGENKNVDDNAVLLEIAESIGLDAARTLEVLNSQEFEEGVKYDIYEAHQLGVKGVPFFVFNNKYGISGAQPLEVFMDTLEKVMVEEGAK
jgi:predicted DsbA family dithiol-disulfide isomerase